MTSGNIFIIFTLLALGFVYIRYSEKKKRAIKQLHFIQKYHFPSRIGESVSKTYPHLTKEEVSLVLDGLRDYFVIALQAEKKMVSMPSQAVDVAWHEFLLFTQAYQYFCKKAFGRFFHHHPVEAMQDKTKAQEGIKLAWKLACDKEGIFPNRPNKLPLLFGLDAQLKIPDGFHYTLHCNSSTTHSSQEYCASHIGCSGAGVGCGGGITDSFGHGDTSGCGGGCGGD